MQLARDRAQHFPRSASHIWPFGRSGQETITDQLSPDKGQTFASQDIGWLILSEIGPSELL